MIIPELLNIAEINFYFIRMGTFAGVQNNISINVIKKNVGK